MYKYIGNKKASAPSVQTETFLCLRLLDSNQRSIKSARSLTLICDSLETDYRPWRILEPISQTIWLHGSL